MRIDGALGFFQRASPPNNNNNNKISSVWGPVPGPKLPHPTVRAILQVILLQYALDVHWAIGWKF